MLWFNFILGLNFISLCHKLIITDYHTPKQRKIKLKPRIKLNDNNEVEVNYSFVPLNNFSLFAMCFAFVKRIKFTAIHPY